MIIWQREGCDRQRQGRERQTFYHLAVQLSRVCQNVNNDSIMLSYEPVDTDVVVAFFSLLRFSLHQTALAASFRTDSFTVLLRSCNLSSSVHTDTVRYYVFTLSWYAVITVCVERVINAAARLVVKLTKWDSITSTLRDTLHWLVRQQIIDFKICLLVYKCLHHRAAQYLESMVTAVSAVSTCRHLRSAGQGDLVVPRTRTVAFGPRSVSVVGPSLWNTLPSDMKLSTLTAALFCRQLKICPQFLRMSGAQPS